MKKKSKNLAKIIAPVALATGCLGILPATSCSKMYTKPVKVADYLHEITYNDYREDTKLETIDEGRNFGCSSVRCGNFYGRNFDYVYNDTPEFIAHVKANKKKHRHESLAICTHFGLRENKLNAGKYKRELELIPNLTMDGINDAGVICSSNVVSMEPNSETASMIPETQPGKENAKQLHVLFIPRYILDNANSAKDAVDLLSDENLNIKGNLNNKMNIHVMIADKNETYIVEFFRKKGSANNHFDVVAQQKSDSIDNPTTIMTNYYCNMSDAAFTNDEKFGVERYEMLKWLYPKTEAEKQAFDMDAMARLLKSVQFSQAYKRGKPRAPWGTEGIELTNCEWYSEKIPQSVIERYDESSEEWQTIFRQFETLKLGYEMKIREEANPAYWITTHNSTYEWDWEHNLGYLRIYVQEDYQHPHNYELKIKNSR